ncbi:MAG TPA: hypothetical protein VGO93_21850, partial [Candidatus Xenobia bacterium]
MLNWFGKRPTRETSKHLPGGEPTEIASHRPGWPHRVGQVGSYKLLRQLGEGGMARVFLAEHQDEALAGQYFAVKMLNAVDDIPEVR